MLCEFAQKIYSCSNPKLGVCNFIFFFFGFNLKTTSQQNREWTANACVLIIYSAQLMCVRPIFISICLHTIFTDFNSFIEIIGVDKVCFVVAIQKKQLPLKDERFFFGVTLSIVKKVKFVIWFVYACVCVFESLESTARRSLIIYTNFK